MAKSDVRAVDHIGITVPDLDAAQKFFEDVLGAEFIYHVRKMSVSGPAIEEALGLPKGATLNAIRMLRLGNGPSLELFSYTVPDQNGPVRPSDMGLQHFSVFVDDIEAVVERVKAHGGAVLGRIDHLPELDGGPNNRYVYTKTPWGTTMELVDIPSPQTYERTTQVRRWQPDKT
jgi:catechol 2,3-dioxygenase-like lactoylglutathione lyase family enzyme